MSKNTKIILEMIEKHGRGLSYMGKCTGSKFKGNYVVLHKTINGGNEVYLSTRTQKEMIEKLSQVIFE